MLGSRTFLSLSASGRETELRTLELLLLRLDLPEQVKETGARSVLSVSHTRGHFAQRSLSKS